MWYVGTSTVNLRRVVPQNSGWYIYNRTYELSGKSLNYGIIWCQADHGNFTIVKFIHIEIGFQSSICGTEGRVYQTGMLFKTLPWGPKQMAWGPGLMSWGKLELKSGRIL